MASAHEVPVVGADVGVVVIPGAFRGAWAVEPVVAGLRSRGCRAVAAMLTGMDPPATAAARDAGVVISLSQWVDDVAAAVAATGASRAVLVGHSQGGMVAASAADLIPELVHGVAFLDAPIPLVGQRGVDLAGAAPSSLPAAGTWLDPHPVAVSEWLPADLAAEVNQRLGPAPLGPSLTPLLRSPLDVPWVAAFCEGTPPGYPSSVTRHRLDAAGEPFMVFDAGHEVPLSAPESVVDWCMSSWGFDQDDVGS